ncbi:MAG: hypothetical protein M9938_11135 [Solirubrobacterales bacterium]|nr:hypothetical protein [Solirubrobacterales bacterium]
MSAPVEAPVTIDRYLESSLTVGEPSSSGPLTVLPVFGSEPRQEYISLKAAIGRGLTVKELTGGASVRDLVIDNPGRSAVLVFEGEEVLGAQQNRTFDTSVLIAAGSRQVVPVSCVEAGRWDGSRHGEMFSSAPQAAHPELRRDKVRQSSRSRSAGGETRADQSAVWQHVAKRSMELGVASPTGSLNDAYESRRDRLREIVAGIDPAEGQIGMIAVAGGEVSAFDLVSRPEVMADLHGALLQGYAFDALVAGESGAELDADAAGEFLTRTLATRILERDGVGLGRDFRFESPDLVGAGLVTGEELVQLSAFPAAAESQTGAGQGTHAPRTRIRRPSRRRKG